MHHMCIQGGLGSGKTFTASVLATLWQELAASKGAEVSLYSNFGLKNSYTIDHYSDWYKVAAADSSICVWDEAHIAFSNRKWAGYGQGIATEMMMYMRKMRCINLYCTPSIANLDSRIRQIIEIVVYCRKEPSGYFYIFKDFQTGELLRTARLPMYTAKKLYKLNLYSTYEFVRGFPLPSTEKAAKTFFEKLNEIHRQKMGLVSLDKGVDKNAAINTEGND